MGITGVSSRSGDRTQNIEFHGGETTTATRPNGGVDQAEAARRLAGSNVCLQDGDTQHCETADGADAVAEATARRDAAIQRMNEQRAVRMAIEMVRLIPRPANSAPNGVSSERDARAFQQCGELTRTRPNAGMVAQQVVNIAVTVASVGMSAPGNTPATPASETTSPAATLANVSPFVVQSTGHRVAHTAAHTGAEVVVDVGGSHALGHLAHSNDPRSAVEHTAVAIGDAALPGAGTLISSMSNEFRERDEQIDCMESAAQRARRNRVDGRRDADRVTTPDRPLEGIDAQRMRTDRDYYDGVLQRLRERSQGRQGARG